MAIWDYKKRVPELWLILLWVLLIATFFVMRYFDSFLTNDVALHGIVSFEFAKDLSESNRIMDSWDPVARSAAGLSIGFDYLFILIYVTLFTAHIFNLNRRLYIRTGYKKVGIVALFAPAVAGIADMIENTALIQQLLEIPTYLFSNMAYFAAFAKFILLGFTGVYFVIGLLMILSKK